MIDTDTALQAQVDAQLMEQGAFTPLELLFNTGRLLYSDYEAWRRGDIELLDDVLMGSLDNIRAELEQAAGYARRVGLVAERQTVSVWEGDGGETRTLRISADARLRELIACRWLPAQQAPQMDLFFDNPVVALTNGIVRALCRGDAAEAERQLDLLYAHSPNHADLPAFDQLLAALTRAQHPVEDARQERAQLLDLTPTAKRLLGARWRELLAPLWRRLAHALADARFMPGDPAMHRSFALSQAEDWSALRECVLAEPEWWLHAPLCLHLANSAFHRRQRLEALEAWCHLCWRAPDHVDEAIERLKQPELTAQWHRFLDLEDEATPDAPALTAADFPAWLLLNEPGLALHLDADLPPGDTAGEGHYRWVHRCIRARRDHDEQAELAARKALQASQPTLFTILKRTLSSARRP